jgi:hypothetical protein
VWTVGAFGSTLASERELWRTGVIGYFIVETPSRLGFFELSP